ncbi:MAG: EcsC family protein [Dermatophilaceae bacterium]
MGRRTRGRDADNRPALERAGDASGGAGGAGGAAGALVERLLDAGIDGRGPFESAQAVAASAREKSRSDEAAVNAIVRRHVATGVAGGFVTGLGGLVTMAVAVPANVIEFYLTATRMVAAIAVVRGYNLTQAQIRTAVLLTLVGAEADDVLHKAGLGAGGRITDLATRRLPDSALMIVNKAVGFRLVSQLGRGVLSRFGRAVPVIGGAVGAGLDGYLMTRIAEHARTEFPPLTST